MGFYADSGRIYCDDGSGNVRFDTDEDLFIPLTELSGSISMSSRSAQNRNFANISLVDLSQSHLLGSCNAAADTIRGAFKMTTSDSRGIVQSGWYNACGSYLHMFEGGYAGLTTGNQELLCMYAYTFYCASGSVYLHERIKLRANASFSQQITNTITVAGASFQYKLIAGVFI
ncbi:MAG: hypothetical protein AB7O13_24755 [Alphaproteobacteria bacterium]